MRLQKNGLRMSGGFGNAGGQSAASQSRRNISLLGGQNKVPPQQPNDPYRPKTAAMPLGSLPRPPTGAYNAGTYNFQSGANNNNSRAKTANLPNTHNPRVKRYEEVIVRLKRLLGQEKRTLRRVRNACAREIEIKTALEKILRACLDDVKNEIAKKKAQSFAKHQNIYCKGYTRTYILFRCSVEA